MARQNLISLAVIFFPTIPDTAIFALIEAGWSRSVVLKLSMALGYELFAVQHTTACLIAEKDCKRNLTKAKILQIELKIDIKKPSGERAQKVQRDSHWCRNLSIFNYSSFPGKKMPIKKVFFGGTALKRRSISSRDICFKIKSGDACTRCSWQLCYLTNRYLMGNEIVFNGCRKFA